MINDWKSLAVMKCPDEVGLVTQRARAPQRTPSALDGRRDIPAGKRRSVPQPCRDSRALPSASPQHRTAAFRAVRGSGRAFACGSGCPGSRNSGCAEIPRARHNYRSKNQDHGLPPKRQKQRKNLFVSILFSGRSVAVENAEIFIFLVIEK